MDKQVIIQATKKIVSIDQGEIRVATIGTQGPAGANPTTVFSFTTAAPTWSITHGTAKYPGVTAVDANGNVILGAVRYVDNNNLTVSFNTAETGKIYLN